MIEVHISNIHAREEFRHNSYVSKAARAVVCGFGIEGYALAIAGLATHDRRQGVIVARKPGNSPTSKTPAVDHDVIRELAKLLDETGLTEIEFERDGVSIRVARHAVASAGRTRAADMAAIVPLAAPVAAPADPAQHPGARRLADGRHGLSRPGARRARLSSMSAAR